METMNVLVCPLCQKDDQIKMVSAMYYEFQGAVAKNIDVSDLDIELMNQLAPPQNSNASRWVGWGINLGFIVGTFVIFLISEYLRVISISMSILCLLSWVFFGSYWYISKGKYASRKLWVEEDKEFSKKNRIWSRLYYCSRDQLVFDTRTPIQGDPKKLNKLIYQIAKSM